MGGGPLRVVIAHDYVTQRGGAERVVLDLLRAFPHARLVTSCWYQDGSYPEFAQHDVQTLWPDKIGALRRDPRRAFPFLAEAFGRHVITDADVVLCSSSGWAHRVRTAAPKIVYCHNPARWLYQPHDYFDHLPLWARNRFVASTTRLRRTDALAARSAAAYVVNSSAVAGRVRAAYGIEASVVPPARGLSPDGPVEPIPGIEPGFWLTVGRARGYKHTETVCEAVASLPGERLVVVGGMHTRMWPLGMTAVHDLSDAQMRWLYCNAVGLIAVAHEDFGLTPVEAQSFGVPSIVLRVGGYLDSTVENVTGIFIDECTPAQIVLAMRAVQARTWDPAVLRRCGERFSPAAFERRMRSVVADVLDPSAAAPLTPPSSLQAWVQNHPGDGSANISA